jgi:hypothetical protein
MLIADVGAIGGVVGGNVGAEAMAMLERRVLFAEDVAGGSTIAN